MKSNYLFACIAVFCLVALSSQTKPKPGGYTRLTPKYVYKDDYCRGALEYGSSQIIQKAIKAGEIYQYHKDYKFKVTEIIYAARQKVSGYNYKYEVKIVDEKKYYEIHSTFIVFRNLKGIHYLSESSHKVKRNYKDDKKDYKKDDKKYEKKEYKKDDKKYEKKEYKKDDKKYEKKDYKDEC